MAELTKCPQCGNSLPADAPGGVCPYCVMQLGGGAGGFNPTANYAPAAEIPDIEQLRPLFPQLEIVELIGRGGMGAVYKARQPSLDRFVALKILLPNIGRDPTFAERFSREARALGRLTHPHIVAVFDSGEREGLYYLVMEYIDGVNLREAIRAEQISPEKALAIVPQICDALQYAHEEGVVHRDIKPENVLLDRKGRVKVADFGLAKLLGQEVRDITLTGTRQAMGTLHYMAPEQYEKPQTVDHRADIYSLGVVFYELLTGKLPLGRFALPSEKVQVDVRLDQVVLKTLEREPERRYQYVSEVRTEVDSIAHSPTPPVRQDAAFSAGRGMHAPFPAPITPPAQTELTAMGRTLAILGGLALASLPLVCVGGAFFQFASHGGTSIQAFGLIGVGLWFVLLILGGVLLACGFALKQKVAEPSAIPPEKQLGLARGNRAECIAAVRGPSIALLIVGLLVAALGAFQVLVVAGIRSPDVVSFFVVGGWHFVVAIVLTAGALKMRHLKAYPLAMLATIVAILPLHWAWLVGLPIGIWALAVLCRPDVRQEFGIVRRATIQGKSNKAWPAVAVVLLVLGIVLVVPVVLVLAFAGSFIMVRQSPSPVRKNYDSVVVGPTAVEHEMKPSQSVAPIEWTNEGPKLGYALPMMLNETQLEAIEAALKEAHTEYLKIEKAHTKRTTNNAGHDVFTIEAFPKERTQLENAFWTKVDAAVPDSQLQSTLRANLPLRQEIFPHGESQQSIEIWKVGAWYHYHWPMGSGNEFKGPNLPRNLQQLWGEAEASDDQSQQQPPL